MAIVEYTTNDAGLPIVYMTNKKGLWEDTIRLLDDPELYRSVTTCGEYFDQAYNPDFLDALVQVARERGIDTRKLEVARVLG